MTAGTTILVSARTTTAGSAGDGDASVPTMTADGTRVAFDTTSTDLVPGDTNGAVRDSVVRDVSANTTTRVGVVAGVAPTGPTTLPVVSPAGGMVSFGYNDAGPPQSALLPGDTNALSDVFGHELAPTDTTPPALNVAVADTTTGRSIPVVATATDASGIAWVRVNGRRAGRAGEAFSSSALLSAGPNSVVVTALDGAGNTTRVVRPVLRQVSAFGPGARAPRASSVRVRATPRLLRVLFRLPVTARVHVDVVRVVPRGPRLDPQLVRVAGPRRAVLRAGSRGVVFRPARLAPGLYRARVTVISPAGLTRTVRSFIVAPRATSRA
jgi:Glucodextranase, domain B